MEKKVTPDLKRKQWCLASNVGQFARPLGCTVISKIADLKAALTTDR